MKLYEKMMSGENLGWCRPYISEDGKDAIAINEGEAVSLMVDGRDFPASEITPDAIKALAQKVNTDYALYSGWSDLHIAAEALREVGCADCPWRDICEAMVVDDEDGGA